MNIADSVNTNYTPLLVFVRGLSVYINKRKFVMRSFFGTCTGLMLSDRHGHLKHVYIHAVLSKLLMIFIMKLFLFEENGDALQTG
jgi:hypothetical protein